MPVEVPCPGCGLKLKAPDNMVGKKAKCKKCDTQFRIPGASQPGDSVGEAQMLSVISMPSPFAPGGASQIPMTAVAPSAKSPVPAAPINPSVGSPTPAAARPGFGSSKPAMPGLPTAPATPTRPASGSVPKPAARTASGTVPKPAARVETPPAGSTPGTKALPSTQPSLPVAEATPAADPFAFEDTNGPEPKGKSKSRDRDEEIDPKTKRKNRDDDDDDDDRPRSKKKNRDDDDDDDRPRSKKKNRDDDDSEVKSGLVSAGDPFAFDFNGEPEANGAVKKRDDALPPVVGGDPFAFDPGPVVPTVPETKSKNRNKDDEEETPRSKKKDRDEDEKPRSKKRDRDDEPTTAAAAPVAGGDLFSFDVAPAAPEVKTETKDKSKKRDRDEEPQSKRKGRDDEDEKPNKKDRKKGRDEEDNEEEERKYVPPGEQKGSKKTLLLAILLGVGALGALIAAVMVMQKQAKEKEAAEAAAAAAKAKKDEKKDEAPPPVEPPKKDPGKKDPGKKDPKDPTPKDPKDPTPKDPPEPPATMLDLPPSAKLLTFTPASSKPDTALAPRGTPIVFDAAIGKIKRVFAPEKRTEQDVVVVWQSVAGANGKGEKLNVDIHSGQTGARVNRIEMDGDGKEPKCDLSPDGKSFVAVSPDGKLTIWSLSDQAPAKTLENYDPYADRPDLKAHGIAGVFFTKAPGRLLTVTTAGAAQLIDPMAKKVIERWSPLNVKLVPNKVVLGKNLAVDDAHSSIVIAVGGGVYQIESATMKTSWKLELGEVGRHLGIGVLGVPGRVVYAFETNNNGKKERAVLFSLSTDKAPTVYRWPDVAGDPSEAMWVDVTLAVVGAEKGVVYFSGAGFKPLGFAESPTKLSNDANENGHWFTSPDPTGAAMRTLFQQFATDDLMDFLRKAGEGAKNPPTSKLSEKGLVK
ncbi:MAG: hypothetical protein C0467_06165 [Planctomycetaceae bacterium]|nr:hypothetical protein [Planctomycetaceae bacterium]